VKLKRNLLGSEFSSGDKDKRNWKSTIFCRSATVKPKSRIRDSPSA